MAPQGDLLHLEPFSGIAGDMLLGALLDLGLPRKQLMDGLSGLGLEFQLRVKSVHRGPLAAKHVDVMVPGNHRSKKKGAKKKGAKKKKKKAAKKKGAKKKGAKKKGAKKKARRKKKSR